MESTQLVESAGPDFERVGVAAGCEDGLESACNSTSKRIYHPAWPQLLLAMMQVTKMGAIPKADKEKHLTGQGINAKIVER